MDDLDRLRKQYFSLFPVYLITLPEPQVLASTDAQRYLVSKLLLLEDEGALESEGSTRRGGRQPEDGYRRNFWRKVVDRMEIGLRESGDDELEIDERFYDVLTDLMVSTLSSNSSSAEAGPSSAPKTSFRSFIYDSPSTHPLCTSNERGEEHGRGLRQEKVITLLEEQIAIQGGTTGLRTWTAALHLAHHILHNPDLVFTDPALSENGVVELGAGTGFISILLAQLGMGVISTDLGQDDESDGAGDHQDEEDAMIPHGVGAGAEIDRTDQTGHSQAQTPLARLQYNVSLNTAHAMNSSSKIMVKSLDWTDAHLPLDQRPAIWRLLDEEKRTIVAADVIYDPDLVPPLVNTINTLLSPNAGRSESVEGGRQARQAIISATIRNQTTFDIFLHTCKQSHLVVTFMDLPRLDEENPTFWDSALDKGTEVKVMRITRMSS
ncbi:uncharacterized protein I303_104413 [Kwoniella dejecticola CBS 10117]|uniref:FAM86 N-terminal domain-containing protein n=1 Tax=Kwoniella dejecticola CBS 10117 TaxID=1296121 RepID=A0A1A6A5E6_9TREE|nr:uncharacterized protein I303_04608 [Kwoniella dejecticola CBS 10117]OBR85275.1 hypothetical protein I303_04608 [Kwoniella dejecticola CBS 10117]